MINFSAISNNSIIGKILRLFMEFIPPNTTVRILQGPLRNKRWIKGSGVNGYWLGSYELEGQKMFIENLNKGDIIFDIGANVGFYSLLAAEIVGPSGKVFSFEPLPENFNYLKKHIEINGYKNIFPFQVAVSDKSGLAFLKIEGSNATGHFGSGDIHVETISLDEWIKNNKLPIPNFLKIDVEGAEFLVLSGAENVLKNHKHFIFLTTHGRGVNKDCCQFLISLGYDLEVIKGGDIENASEILVKP